jgi:hypothetical protein
MYLHLHKLSVPTQEQQSEVVVLVLIHRTVYMFCKNKNIMQTKLNLYGESLKSRNVKFVTSELYGTFTFHNLRKYLRKSKLTAKTGKTPVISVTCGCFTLKLKSHTNI